MAELESVGRAAARPGLGALLGAAALGVTLSTQLAIVPARYFALELGQLGFASLWQVLCYPLIQPAGATGVLGQLLMCVGLYWSVSELERGLGTARTASTLLVSSVVTALAAASFVDPVAAPRTLAGADVLILAALASHVALNPERPLPLVDGGLSRPYALLVLGGGCVLLYGVDRDALMFGARLFAIAIGGVAHRIDLAQLLRGSHAAETATESATSNALGRRWRALRRQLSGELAQGSLPPPAAEAAAPSRYWQEVDPALPLDLVDPLHRER